MANYPSSQNTDNNLYVAVNNLSTVLTDDPLTAGATTVNVSDASSFPSVGIITIDLEAIHYTGKTATSFTGCTRGFDGTTAASHSVNATVFHDIPAAHHNVLKDEIIAVTDDLRAVAAALDDTDTPGSTSTDVKDRLDQVVSQLKLITGETNWYDSPATTISALDTLLDSTAAALDDADTPASTASDLKDRLDQIVSQLKLITGETNWYDAPDNTIAALESQQNTNETNISTNTSNISTNSDNITLLQNLLSYRRPLLEYVNAAQLDVENNTGTANQTKIVFPDGNTRSVTEDTSSTNKYRRFDITATAEFTSGTEDSGLRSGLSEASNTWYAIYAVKSQINSSNFVLVGDTILPIQANYSTLNSNFGTDSWIYLGMIRNGDNQSAGSDILQFEQSGNQTILSNVVSATGTGNTVVGMELATTGSASNLTYSYSAGTGATNIPNQIKLAKIVGAGDSQTQIFANASVNNQRRLYSDYDSSGSTNWVYSNWVDLTVNVTLGATASSQYDIYLNGWIDNSLGVGPNPVI